MLGEILSQIEHSELTERQMNIIKNIVEAGINRNMLYALSRIQEISEVNPHG
jgi:predicted transcriptional regulator